MTLLASFPAADIRTLPLRWTPVFCIVRSARLRSLRKMSSHASLGIVTELYLNGQCVIYRQEMGQRLLDSKFLQSAADQHARAGVAGHGFR